MSAFERIKPGLVPVGGGSDEPGYLLSAELAEAANVALLLGRPLLVTGEPGTGKTSLAYALAARLGAELLEFHCKSVSVGRDLLYQFDHLQRLYDAQHPGAAPKKAAEYVSLGALGRAIAADSPKLVLIDEIDKAPRDFPNDLLNELSRCRFEIPEVGDGRSYTCKVPPAIVITSNSERQLPLPFLRRCTYFHIEYPSTEALAQILTLHTRGLDVSKSLLSAAVTRFEELRKVPGLIKKPATDELVAWARVLHALGVSSDRLERDRLVELPGLSAVLKSVEDMKRLRS